ncbi:MAG: hypothetical protein Tp152DCM46671_40 [Prokaryotic dsDNA virus sp.]|nr:MAG: hypothetical protein Tp152DCM46671_40 [Prokaryotic dsDNA virus sp.]|tara:strand:- start:37056 stop:37526 length:471 start_codon:yes stop_codon:yes gene_type:complete
MATLSVTITESCTLNGKDQGGTYSSFSNASITQVTKKIVKCLQDTEVALYKTADGLADATGGATYKEGSIKYVRITNNASSNHVLLMLKNIANEEVYYKLGAKESFLLHSHDGALAVGADDNADPAVDSNDDDIELVVAEAKGGASELEVFIASID